MSLDAKVARGLADFDKKSSARRGTTSLFIWDFLLPFYPWPSQVSKNILSLIQGLAMAVV